MSRRHGATEEQSSFSVAQEKPEFARSSELESAGPRVPRLERTTDAQLRGVSASAAAPSAARVRPEHPCGLWPFPEARGMLGVVVQPSWCLVHVVSIRARVWEKVNLTVEFWARCSGAWERAAERSSIRSFPSYLSFP